VKLQPVLKGKQQQSWVCSVAEHGVPIPENWKAFFIGYEAAIKQKLLIEYEAYEDFAKVDRDQDTEHHPDLDSVGF
jgi:hypothetical protein